MSEFNKSSKVLDINMYLKEPLEISKKNTGINIKDVVWSWIGAFLGIMVISAMHNWLHLLSNGDFGLMIGSFGATAVLAYGAIDSPLAQPRNIIGGHILSGFVGVISFKLFGSYIWFASAIAVSTAIAIMQITKTVHPPGGATALIAVIGGAQIHKLGFLYPLAPVGVGATVMVLIALLMGKVSGRKYPN